MSRYCPRPLGQPVAKLIVALCLVGAAVEVGRAEPAAPGFVALENSPRPEWVAASDAWRMAEAHAASIPGGDVMVGQGDSMQPLYPDRTVIVVQRLAMADLRPGMTVVFIGDSGRPVAHTLVAKTSRGWIAKGVGNSYVDRTPVRMHNYLGTVVRAFLPVKIGSSDSLMAAALTGGRTVATRVATAD
jgi:hypothetical protein